jgi:hypothetical protein
MLSNRLLLGLCAAALVFAAALTFLKYVENGLSDKGFPDDGARANESYAKNKGVFVCEAHCLPSYTPWHGQIILFDSAWVERKVKTKPFLVWWTTVEPRPGYYLVVRSMTLQNIPFSENLFLVRQGAGEGFGSHGTASYDDDLTEDEFKRGSTVVNLVNGWHTSRENPITINWKP